MRNLSSGKDFRAQVTGKGSGHRWEDSHAMKRLLIALTALREHCPRDAKLRTKEETKSRSRRRRWINTSRKLAAAGIKRPGSGERIVVVAGGAILRSGVGSALAPRRRYRHHLVQESASAVSTGAIEDFARFERAMRASRRWRESRAPPARWRTWRIWARPRRLMARNHQPPDHFDDDRFGARDACAGERQPGDRRDQEAEREFGKPDHYGARRDPPDRSGHHQLGARRLASRRWRFR